VYIEVSPKRLSEAQGYNSVFGNPSVRVSKTRKANKQNTSTNSGNESNMCSRFKKDNEAKKT